jgi:hypothetical protein
MKKLKPQKINSFYHGRIHRSYDLMLDRNTQRFFVQINSLMRIEDDGALACTRLAKEAIDKMVEFRWEPFIIMSGGRPAAQWQTVVQCSIDFRRIEVSPNPSDPTQRVFRRHRDDVPRDTDEHFARWEAGDESAPLHLGSEIITPYDDRVWQSLLYVKWVLETQQEQINAILQVGRNNPEYLPAAMVAIGAGAQDKSKNTLLSPDEDEWKRNTTSGSRSTQPPPTRMASAKKQPKKGRLPFPSSSSCQGSWTPSGGSACTSGAQTLKAPLSIPLRHSSQAASLSTTRGSLGTKCLRANAWTAAK